MASAVVMPKAGITVETCIMGKWEKNVGDYVNIGDILFTYETDKATFECESTEEGELLEIFFREGDEVPVLVNVCAVGQKGEDVTSLRPDAAGQPAAAPGQTETAQRTVPAADKAASEAPADTEVGVAAVPEPGELKISPRAKNLADRSGADARLAVPSGPHGRVIERDIRTLLESGEALKAEATKAKPQAAEASPAAELKAPEGIGYKDVKFSVIRRTISKAMHSSISSMAQLTHHHTFDAAEVMEYRKKLKDAGGDVAGISVTDIILYAVSRTLVNYPDLNANMLDENTIRLFDHVHLDLPSILREALWSRRFSTRISSRCLRFREAKALAPAAFGRHQPRPAEGRDVYRINLGSLGWRCSHRHQSASDRDPRVAASCRG